MPVVIVDGQEIELAEGERLNGIQAAARVGTEVPHYCWHAGLSVVASCRMCLVETGKRDANTGEISMMPKLVPACQTPATDGTVFVTDSDKVRAARAMVEEDLLIDHPIDCPICDKAGECNLQDYYFEHGQEQRRADLHPFTSRRREMGSTVSLFVDRCVMCSRCVRFCREVAGTSELMVINRGASEEIDVFPGYPLENKLSGNVVDLCPVGALGDKDFLYQQRVWFMKGHDHVCDGCSTGCSIRVDENQQRVYRLKPRENPHVNQWWMCDEGRYGWKHVHALERLTELSRLAPGSNGNGVAAHESLDWSQLPALLEKDFKAAGKLGVVLSPHLTVEEAYLLASYARQIDPEAVVALGYVPVAGEDEAFRSGFTIRAEKCPNRRGVSQIASRFQERLIEWDEFIQRVEQGEFGAAWISGGYKSPWHDEATAEKFAGLKQLVVQDIFDSSLMQRANYRLPGGVFAEREGSYVNFNDRLQSFRWAVRPPSGVLTEGHLYWRLLGKSGMFKAREVMEEIAREVSFFAAAMEEVPPHGVDLRVNMLAGV